MEIELNLLKRKIIEGEFFETLSIFEELEKKFGFFTQNEIMHLNARVNKFNQERLKGNDSSIEFNKLMDAVISIYDQYILKLNKIVTLIFELKEIGKYDTALCELKKISPLEIGYLQEDISKFQYENKYTEFREEIVSRIKNTDYNKIYFPTKEKSDGVVQIMIATTVFLLSFLFPLFFSSEGVSGFFEKQDLLYHLNISLQLGTITYFLVYTISPKISIKVLKGNVDKFMPFINENFRSKSQFIWYAKRANHTIGQFGKWWRYLLASFLVLYIFYYSIILYEFFKGDIHYRYAVLLCDLEIIINGIEAFFLFTIFRIFSGKTFTTDPLPSIDFKPKLNVHKEFFLLQVALIIFLTGQLIWEDSGVFILFNRILSSMYVALSFILFISHLGKEIFNAKKWELQLFYSYAVIQVLFVLFDKSAFQFMFNHAESTLNSLRGKNISETIDRYFVQIKSITFYTVLILRTYLFYFILKAFKKNRLFTYFMLVSKRVETKDAIESFRQELL